MKIVKTGLINLAVFSTIIVSIEISLNIARYIKHGIHSSSPVSSKTIQMGKPIKTSWKQVFHPGVGHSHQKSEFIKNVNTFNLIHDNISATEVFQSQKSFDSEFKILVLGGSTTDPLGTQYSGYRGTWVHHLFEGISQNNSSRYLVDNAGNGGSTSSNELLRLITKLHSNHYDLAISFNGINEKYFADYTYLMDKENILASRMVVQGMGDFGILKGLDNKIYFSPKPIFIVKNSRTYKLLVKIKQKLIRQKQEGFTGLLEKDKDMLAYAANIWAKNIDFMNSVSLARNVRYLAILQPTLGIGRDYCSIGKECMLSNPKYIARINYIYLFLREHCNTREYCLDISSDQDLTSNDLLYTDPRHPNSKGNKRIAELIQNRISQILSN